MGYQRQITKNFSTNVRKRAGSRLLAAALGGLLLTPAVASATEDECDFWAQDCNGDDRCIPSPDYQSLSCMATENPDPWTVGEPCHPADEMGPDSCGPRSMCYGVDPWTDEGTCVEFCTGNEETATCEELNSACVHFGWAGLCLPSCDPLIADCPVGEMCVPTWMDENRAGDYFCSPIAVPEDEGHPGDDCEYVNTCQSGAVCIAGSPLQECSGETIGCCTYFCDLDELNSCMDEELECVPVYTESPFDRVGFCVSETSWIF